MLHSEKERDTYPKSRHTSGGSTDLTPLPMPRNVLSSGKTLPTELAKEGWVQREAFGVVEARLDPVPRGLYARLVMANTFGRRGCHWRFGKQASVFTGSGLPRGEPLQPGSPSVKRAYTCIARGR